MRIATFNLLHGRSLGHGGVEVADLHAAAREIDADVIGLQEVDRHQERSGLVDQTAEVAAASGAEHWRFVPAVSGTPGTERAWTRSYDDDGAGTSGPTYGVGLVSRWPVRSWAVRRFAAAPVGLPLMVPGHRGLTQVPDEPRVAVTAVVDAPTGPMTIVTAHLSFVPGWNIAQLRALATWARTMPGPRLLVGDFNLPGALPRMVTRWSQLAQAATYPSWKPRVQFDHVLGDGITEAAVHDVQVLRLPISDHCALVVDLRL